MTPRYDAVIFDLDGTLLYTLPDLHSSLNAALRECGYAERTLDETRRFIGNGSRKLIERALPGEAENPDVDRVLAVYRRVYRENLVVGTVPYPGMESTLFALRDAGLRLGVATNKPHENARYIIDTCFPGLFAAVEGSREGQPLKPDPAPVLRALRTLGVEASRSLYAGDSDVDYYTAVNSGADSVLCAWGYRARPELEKLSPPAIIDSPGELLNIIR